MPSMYKKEEGRVYRRNQTIYHGQIISSVQVTNQKGMNKFTPRVTSLVTSFDTIGSRLESTSASFGRAIQTVNKRDKPHMEHEVMVDKSTQRRTLKVTPYSTG